MIFFRKSDEPFLVVEDFLGPFGLVLEGDLHALVDVADHFEPLANGRGIEFHLREDRRVGMEVDGRPGAARRAGLLQRAGRLAALERHLPARAVALDRRVQIAGQRVDDARADAVQTAGGLVVLTLELAARVEHREDDFERALLGRRVLVDRNASPIVGDGDRAAVLVQHDVDVRGVAVHRLVHGVVENSQTRWCRPVVPTPPMYMPGRLRTGSSPSRTVMSFAV